jgi:hypothetical protein
MKIFDCPRQLERITYSPDSHCTVPRNRRHRLVIESTQVLDSVGVKTLPCHERERPKGHQFSLAAR